MLQHFVISKNQTFFQKNIFLTFIKQIKSDSVFTNGV